MDGSAELRQLAHLLRVGAEVAGDIAGLRPRDADDILRLAEEARAMADQLDAIDAKRGGHG